jgi:putative ABC transport system permease protein
VFVRIRPDDVAGSLAILRETWDKVLPDEPFEYAFLDQSLDRQYAGEDRWVRILGYTSALAVLISFLGLVGLASLAAARRTKEVGIRKALGATAASVIRLLSSDYLKLVLLANLLAWPPAYYMIRKWLEQFPYRTDVGPEAFGLAGAVAIAVALIAVSSQAMKAAGGNPVEALRYE